MNAEELRQLEPAELEVRIRELQEEVFRTRFQHATSQLQNSAKLRDTRRALARAKTVLSLKQLGK
jgi:large subunit ribosomal protein L29